MRECTLNKEQKDSLAAYLMGSLGELESRLLADHLERGCQYCQHEIDELNEVMALLAETTPMATPSESVRSRLLARVAAEPRLNPPLQLVQNISQPQPWYRRSVHLLGRVAAALVILMLFATETVYLIEYKRQARQQEAQIAGLKEQISKKQNLITTMSTSRKLIILDGKLIKASGQAFWDTNQNTLLIYIEKLPPAPKGKIYQLWFIAEEQVVSGGIFQTDSNGSVQLPMTMPKCGSPIIGAAISLEPEGGSTQPRGAVYLSGSI